MRLSNQIVERLWPIFSGENLVTHVLNLNGNAHWRKLLEMQTNVHDRAALDKAVSPRIKRPRQFPGGALCQTARIIGSLSCSKRRDSKLRHHSSPLRSMRSRSRLSA